MYNKSKWICHKPIDFFIRHTSYARFLHMMVLNSREMFMHQCLSKTRTVKNRNVMRFFTNVNRWSVRWITSLISIESRASCPWKMLALADQVHRLSNQWHWMMKWEVVWLAEKLNWMNVSVRPSACECVNADCWDYGFNVHRLWLDLESEWMTCHWILSIGYESDEMIWCFESEVLAFQMIEYWQMRRVRAMNRAEEQVIESRCHVRWCAICDSLAENNLMDRRTRFVRKSVTLYAFLIPHNSPSPSFFARMIIRLSGH